MAACRIILAAGLRSRVPRQCVEGIAMATGGEIVAVYDQTNRIPATALPMSDLVFVLKDMAAHKTVEMLRVRAAKGQGIVMISSKRSLWEPRLRELGLLASDDGGLDAVEAVPAKAAAGPSVWPNCEAYLRALAENVGGPIHRSDALRLSLAATTPLSWRSPNSIAICSWRAFGPSSPSPHRELGLLMQASRKVLALVEPPESVASDWRPEDQGRFMRLWAREMLALVESGTRSGIMSGSFKGGNRWSGPSPDVRMPGSILTSHRAVSMLNACLDHLPEVDRDAALRREDWDACAARALERFEAGEDPGPYTRGPWPLSPANSAVPAVFAIEGPYPAPSSLPAPGPPVPQDDKSILLASIVDVARRMQVRLDGRGAADLATCLSLTPLVGSDFVLSGDDVASALAPTSDASWPLADLVTVVRILDDLTGDGDAQCSALRRTILERDSKIESLRWDLHQMAAQNGKAGAVPQDYIDAGAWIRRRREEELAAFVRSVSGDLSDAMSGMVEAGVISMTLDPSRRLAALLASATLIEGGVQIPGMDSPLVLSFPIPESGSDA